MLKKCFLSLLAGLLLLSSCARSPGTSTLLPSSSPKVIASPSLSSSLPAIPQPSKEPLNLAQVAYEMDIAQSAIKRILSTYPTYSVKDWERTPTVMRYDMIILQTSFWYEPIKIENFQNAQIHLANAYSLADKGKLPNETTTHKVTPAELAYEIRMAISFLKSQRELVLNEETYIVNWIKNYNEWRLKRTPLPESVNAEYQAQCISNAIKFCDDLATEIASINSRLEIIFKNVNEAASVSA